MIPTEMLQYRAWIVWRYESDGRDKPTKVPYNPLTGMRASVTDPQTWCDYNTAVVAIGIHYHGIGFMLSENDPYCIVDLDNPEGNKEWIERHGSVMTQLNSYTEWSPSGKGVHIITRGSLPTGKRRGKIEMYSNVRFITMTGRTVYDVPIMARPEILEAMYNELGGDTRNLLTYIDRVEKYTDAQIYEMAFRASNGQKFADLWNGQWEKHYPPPAYSQSEADLGLVDIIGFYSKNLTQVSRMFLQSGLGWRLRTGIYKKHKHYIRDMALKSFDKDSPDIDFTAMKDAEIAKLRKKATPVAGPKFDVPPLVWSDPPGLVGEITRFIFASAPVAVREIALSGALALMAGICGRAYNVSDEGLNMYILALALTGVGKEGAAKGIGKIMDRVELIIPGAAEFRGPSEIASGPALTKHLANKAPCCFSTLGEFGMRLHELCNDKAQSHMVGLRRVLLDLFHKSGKGQSLRPHIYSDKDKNTETVYSPAFTILGESTPDTFYRYLDDSMISDGLLPRFTIIEYSGDRGYVQRGFGKIKPNDEMIQQIAELCVICLQMHTSKRVVDTMFTPDAEALSWKISDEYTDRINKDRDNEIGRQLLNRAHIKILKIAALIAIGVSAVNPVITVEYIMWAKNLVDRDIANILYKFQVGKVGRETGEINQTAEIIKIVKDYMQTEYGQKLANYHVPQEMHAKLVVPYQFIFRRAAPLAAFRQDTHGGKFAIKKAIETLCQEGALKELKSHVVERDFGKYMEAYVIIDPKVFS